MRYLKKFNEELKPRTYISAANKLTKLGHTTRAKELEDWAEKVESREDLIKWKDHLQDYAPFGKFKITVKNPKTEQKFTDDFYLDIAFDSLGFEDNFEYEKERDGDNITSVGIPFFIGIIPSSEECIAKCRQIMPEPEFGNGMFWGMALSIDFDVINRRVNLKGLTLDNYDTGLSGHVSFADRASAGRFKMLLKQIFSNPKLGYPSGYTDVPHLYQKLEQIIEVNQDFEGEYGFSLDGFADFISGFSANSLYKAL